MNKMLLALAATLFAAACQVEDDQSGNPGGDPVQQCTANNQCPSPTTWTQGFCNYGTCDHYAINCGGIRTRRTNGQATLIEAYAGWGGQQPAPRLGQVPVTTSYADVPYTGVCAVVSNTPFDCTIEYAGGSQMAHKEYHGVTICSFDGLNNRPDDPAW